MIRIAMKVESFSEMEEPKQVLSEEGLLRHHCRQEQRRYQHRRLFPPPSSLLMTGFQNPLHSSYSSEWCVLLLVTLW